MRLANKRVFEALVKSGACDGFERAAGGGRRAARGCGRGCSPRSTPPASTAAARSATRTWARPTCSAAGDGGGGRAARPTLPDVPRVDRDRAAQLREGGARAVLERATRWTAMRPTCAIYGAKTTAELVPRKDVDPGAGAGRMARHAAAQSRPRRAAARTSRSAASSRPASAEDAQGRPHVRVHARRRARAASRSWCSRRRSSSTGTWPRTARWCSSRASSSATTRSARILASEIAPIEVVQRAAGHVGGHPAVDAAARPRDVRAAVGRAVRSTRATAAWLDGRAARRRCGHARHASTSTARSASARPSGWCRTSRACAAGFGDPGHEPLASVPRLTRAQT